MRFSSAVETWQIWAAFWPTAGGDPEMTGKMNGIPKYVVSNTLRDRGVLFTTFQVDPMGDTDLSNDVFIDGSWSLLKDAGSHPARGGPLLDPLVAANRLQ